MTFDQSVLFWSVFVPVMLATGTFFIGRAATRISTFETYQLDTLLFGAGWWASIAVSLYGRQGWPDAEWQLCLWPLVVWAVLPWLLLKFGPATETSTTSRDYSWRWMVVSAASALTAIACLPRGEAWQDSYHLHGPWGTILTFAMLLNAWAMEQMSRRKTERWVLLVALASLGGPVALAAATYGSLTEWSVAMVSATLVFAVAAGLFADCQACGIAPLVTAAGTCVAAAGRFQTFEDYPTWLYAAMLFLPSAVSFIDFLLRQKHTVWRFLTAALVCIAFVSYDIWFFLLRETESW